MQYVVVFVNGEQYYGVKVSINVWVLCVIDVYEFSLFQIWLIFGLFGYDLNIIEVGWQVLFVLLYKYDFCLFKE